MSRTPVRSGKGIGSIIASPFWRPVQTRREDQAGASSSVLDGDDDETCGTVSEPEGGKGTSQQRSQQRNTVNGGHIIHLVSLTMRCSASDISIIIFRFRTQLEDQPEGAVSWVWIMSLLICLEINRETGWTLLYLRETGLTEIHVFIMKCVLSTKRFWHLTGQIKKLITMITTIPRSAKVTSFPTQ